MLPTSIVASTELFSMLSRSTCTAPLNLVNAPGTLLTMWRIVKPTDEWTGSILKVSTAAGAAGARADATAARARILEVSFIGWEWRWGREEMAPERAKDNPTSRIYRMSIASP